MITAKIHNALGNTFSSMLPNAQGVITHVDYDIGSEMQFDMTAQTGPWAGLPVQVELTGVQRDLSGSIYAEHVFLETMDSTRLVSVDASVEAPLNVTVAMGSDNGAQILIDAFGLDLRGNVYNNFMRGGAISDALRGNGGNDGLTGRGGDDMLSGGVGNDLLTGGGGDDTLLGGYGLDTMVGQAGEDTFVFDAEADGWRDVVRDFSEGDIIDLRTVDANVMVAGNQRFQYLDDGSFTHAGGELNYDIETGIIRADTDGDARADMLIFMSNHYSLDSFDFIL